MKRSISRSKVAADSSEDDSVKPPAKRGRPSKKIVLQTPGRKVTDTQITQGINATWR